MRRTLLLVLTAAATLRAQGTAPRVEIITPTADTIVQGAQLLSADVLPATAEVRAVTIFVDGEQVCRLTARPFSCSWEAGGEATGRNVRAVAELADGRRVIQTLRTKAREGFVATFHSATDTVMVPVQVTDDRGRLVRGLTVRDFRLTEDGVVQPLSELLPQTTNTNILLTLDMSGSMAPLLPDLKRAAREFLGSARPQDTISIAAFNSTMYPLAGPASDSAARLAAIDRLRPVGTTALYDCMIRAVETMKTQPVPRAVVIFTDGQDSTSRASLNAARSAFQSNDVVLYLIIQGEADAKSKSKIEALADLARETGGAARFAKRMENLTAEFSGIVEELGSRYILAYTPQRSLGDGSWRTIAVEVPENRKYRITSREGYLASRGSPDSK